MTWPFLDARERALVADALPAAGDAREELERQLARLGEVARVARQGPAGLSPRALVDRLSGRRHDVDLRLPPVAALGQAYLMLKVVFLRELAAALAGAPAELRRRADVELAQSIHSHLVEELFVSVASDAGVDEIVRRGAARKLLVLWQDPVQVEIDDVAPLLDAIWEARCRLRPTIGSLLGTQEIFALFQSARDERFLDHFAGGDLPDDELQAYQEFLFGLSTEECVRLRAEMDARSLAAVSLDEARRLLDVRDAGEPVGAVGPDAMAVSYRARRVRAIYRALTGAPGPRRTAEEYVIIARLARGEAL
jgi:hypothetical protein